MFGNLTSSNGGGDDHDGDASSDELEFLAGTDPRDPTSNFIPAYTFDGTHSIEASFPGIANRGYTLLVSETLSGWTAGDSVGPLTTNGAQSLSHTTGSGTTQLFGRIGIFKSGASYHVPEGYSYFWGGRL